MRRAIEVIIFTACLLAALVLPEQACLAAAGEPHAVLPKGTVLTLKLQEEISSDTAQSGDEVKALLLGEVAIDGVPILVSRTHAEAEITHVHGSGVYGHSGTLTVEVRAIRALNGVVIPLEGEKARRSLTMTMPGRRGWSVVSLSKARTLAIAGGRYSTRRLRRTRI